MVSWDVPDLSNGLTYKACNKGIPPYLAFTLCTESDCKRKRTHIKEILNFDIDSLKYLLLFLT
jgi:hypothetical protein